MSTDTQSALTKLDAARRAIVEVKTIPDAKKLLDEFSTLLDYAKRQRMELEVQNEVAECRIWTRRKLGTMLAEMPKAQGTRGQLVGPGVIGPSSAEGLIDEPATLSEMGISYTESSRMQAEATVPHESITNYVAAKKEKDQEITASDIYRMAQRLKQEAEREQQDENELDLIESLKQSDLYRAKG